MVNFKERRHLDGKWNAVIAGGKTERRHPDGNERSLSVQAKSAAVKVE